MKKIRSIQFKVFICLFISFMVVFGYIVKTKYDQSFNELVYNTDYTASDDYINFCNTIDSRGPHQVELDLEKIKKELGNLPKDDMTEILRKMHEADVIVLSTPVYKSCMCAQLKTLIDRMFAANKTLKNKEFYFIATAADQRESIESTMMSMRGCTYAVEGAIIKGEIYGANSVMAGDIKNTPAMEEAYEAGRKC